MSTESNIYRQKIAHEEIIVRSTIQYWWSRRWFIAISMIVAMSVFSAILLIMPKDFRAQASIIIMPPRFIPEIRTQPLTVLTAKSLLETNELYEGVIQHLRRYRHVIVRISGKDYPDKEAVARVENATVPELMADGRVNKDEAEEIAALDATEIRGILQFDDDELVGLTVDSMGRKLYSQESVEKKTAAELIYSPVLQLYAVSNSGDKAQVMVNIWARLFEEKYESLTRGQTQKLFESLESQQHAGQEELEDVQKTIVDFKLKNNLELIQRQITDYSSSFSTNTRRLISKIDELTMLNAKNRSLNGLLDNLEGSNYNWIGSVVVDGISTQSGDLQYVASYAPDTATTSASEIVKRRRGEAMQSRQALMDALNRASIFDSVNQVDLMTSERLRLESEYMREKTAFQTNRIQVQVAGESLEMLDKTIVATSQTVPLMTALPDEVLGNAITSGRNSDIEKIASVHLNKEQLNPLWETLVKQRAEVSERFHEAQATVAELSKGLQAKEQLLQEMGDRIFLARQGAKLVDARVDRFNRINEKLFNDYANRKEEIFDTGWQITMAQDEVDSLKDAVVKSREGIETLRKSYEAAAAKLEVLELRKKAVTQRADLLIQKLQESMVAIREEVSDVSIASKAVAPTRHYFPPRILLLAIMTILTAVLLLGGMSRKRYRQLMAE